MRNVIFNKILINKYNTEGPRYTSYPTAANFHSEFLINRYLSAVDSSNKDLVPRELSLYIHIPFCNSICYYCACNKVITKNKEKATEYLHYLQQEIDTKGRLFDNDRRVMQLHFGGGTPTFLSDAQIKQLMDVIRRNFNLSKSESRDYAIEVDPRTVTRERLRALSAMGFNRISFGVQDFNPETQKAVNRIQDESMIFSLVEDAKEVGFQSVSVDLIYGLPFQTPDTFTRTMERIVELAPDRVSVFNYAHLPERFKPQRRINQQDLPLPADKLKIYQNTIKQLTDAGYVFIGMDHFALPQDALSKAQGQRKLNRNFQGYTTHADCDLISFGVSAISYMDDCYTQNCYDIAAYIELVRQGSLPITKGLCLVPDDQIRREVIMQLICHFAVDKTKFEEKYEIEFDHYFQAELSLLEPMRNDGLLELKPENISITNKGRLLARVVCMVFDKYLSAKNHGGFSKVI